MLFRQIYCNSLRIKKLKLPLHNLLYKSKRECMKWRYSLTSFAQSCCCEYKFSKKSLNYHFTVNETVVTQTLELSFHRHQNCRNTVCGVTVDGLPYYSGQFKFRLQNSLYKTLATTQYYHHHIVPSLFLRLEILQFPIKFHIS